MEKHENNVLKCLSYKALRLNHYEHEDLMSRFLLVVVSLAQFCLVLCPLRHHRRRCLE